ncbi:unnamed protein product [Moneuplotes crassus]|uniref:Uncharacterized protein n=1 Tax=Euplotes crassus TaxID=5936 RepID=A0AAD1UNL1_EUPCR|nr:unnamed protein product [Moneuplotes crassus]
MSKNIGDKKDTEKRDRLRTRDQSDAYSSNSSREPPSHQVPYNQNPLYQTSNQNYPPIPPPFQQPASSSIQSPMPTYHVSNPSSVLNVDYNMNALPCPPLNHLNANQARSSISDANKMNLYEIEYGIPQETIKKLLIAHSSQLGEAEVTEFINSSFFENLERNFEPNSTPYLELHCLNDSDVTQNKNQASSAQNLEINEDHSVLPAPSASLADPSPHNFRFQPFKRLKQASSEDQRQELGEAPSINEEKKEGKSKKRSFNKKCKNPIKSDQQKVQPKTYKKNPDKSRALHKKDDMTSKLSENSEDIEEELKQTINDRWDNYTLKRDPENEAAYKDKIASSLANNITCSICKIQTQFDDVDTIMNYNCHGPECHYFHKECFKQKATNILQKAKRPLKCFAPDCESDLDQTTVRNIIEKEYVPLFSIACLSLDFSLFYCLTCDIICRDETEKKSKEESKEIGSNLAINCSKCPERAYNLVEFWMFKCHYTYYQNLKDRREKDLELISSPTLVEILHDSKSVRGLQDLANNVMAGVARLLMKCITCNKWINEEYGSQCSCKDQIDEGIFFTDINKRKSYESKRTGMYNNKDAKRALTAISNLITAHNKYFRSKAKNK